MDDPHHLSCSISISHSEGGVFLFPIPKSIESWMIWESLMLVHQCSIMIALVMGFSNSLLCRVRTLSVWSQNTAGGRLLPYLRKLIIFETPFPTLWICSTNPEWTKPWPNLELLPKTCLPDCQRNGSIVLIEGCHDSMFSWMHSFDTDRFGTLISRNVEATNESSV